MLSELGKFRIPDEIFDKSASLTQRERVVINPHSFETYPFLRHISVEEIARWAAIVMRSRMGGIPSASIHHGA
ncbi:hypothetical protein EHZ86_15530 [Aeromonas australiensis]|uniref:hypothetical protein n=1 Tax=Aeromonas australiensis TaxID=1114880 RepID=UPI001F2BE8B0|nr:hypothetical protein [Aeromonas australiensis]MCF3098652.1 hypothetical protein [Aeromonas australiensis]